MSNRCRSEYKLGRFHLGLPLLDESHHLLTLAVPRLQLSTVHHANVYALVEL